MKMLALLLLLWAQGLPVQPTQGGTITGVLKDSGGKPAVGIRMAAVARPDSIEELTNGAAAMSALGETDELGRYKLENVPPGRYFIAAGNLNFPTYYPGTQALLEGKTIFVNAGETVPGIDFALKDSSGGRIIGNSSPAGLGGFAIPLDFRVEGGKIPIFGGGKITTVRLVPVAGGNPITATVNDGSIPLTLVSINDYQVSIEGLPQGYSVKTVRYGGTEIRDGILKIGGVTLSAVGPLQQNLVLQVGPGLFTNLVGGTVMQGASPVPQTLSITLTKTPVSRSSGITVTGQFGPNVRGAFLSGTPAAIYVDRSFEFFNVPPGRHALTAFSGNTSATYAASIIVGDQDINGIELEQTSALPLNARTVTPPGPVGNRAPGRLPLASVRGKIVEAETGEPLTQGEVYLVGDYWTGHPLTSDGSFEFQKLLPGNYQIEVRAVGYPTIRKEFSIDEQDLVLEVKSN
jgi:hypothetical protein